MSEVTEIIEEVTRQLEIIESNAGQIEVIAEDKTTIEVIESSFFDSQIRGSVTSSQNSISITGSNTFFTTDLSIGDTVKIRSASFDLKFTIASIESDTLLTLGGLWTGNTYTSSLIFKQLPGGSVNTGDLNVELENNTIVIEPTNVDGTIIVVDDSSTTIDIQENIQTVEIFEKAGIISGGFDFTFNNVLRNPFNTNEDLNRIGSINIIDPQFELQISGTIFSNTLSSSQMNIQGLGDEDLFSIQILDNNPSLRVNSQGTLIFDEFVFTPTAVEGGLIYSGSSFYLGFD
jgi:hypothetical protein